MRYIALTLALFANAAFAQQPAGIINTPIYATGYISQVGGTTVTTNIPAQPNHPTNLNIYATGSITTWNIKLPNPAFEGQVLGFNCSSTVTTINVQTSDGSAVDSNIPTSCSVGSGFGIQFDQRSNIWRNLGYFNTTTISPGQMPAFVGGDCTSTIGTVVLICTKTNGVVFASSATVDTTNPININYNQGLTGSKTVTVKSWLDNYLIATNFTGVDPSGATDSTSGLQSAIAAMVTTGKTLYLPCGNYKISGSGTQVFLVSEAPINILGENKNCVIFKTAGVGASTDIILQSLTTLVYGSSISGISVDGAGGRNPYRLNANASGFLYGARFVNNNLYVANASSFYFNGNSSGNGGIGHSTIGEDSNLSSITCVYCGDRLIINKSIFSGTSAAFDGSFVTGAGSFTFAENTVSNSGGCVVLRSGAFPRIINNEFEVGTVGSPPNNACIDFWGNTNRIYGGEILGNTISILSAAGSPGPDIIRIDSADAIQIENNRLSLYYLAGAFHYKFTANAAPLLPFIGGLNKYEIISSGASTPYIFNGSGYNAGCAPPMDGNTSKFLRQGPGGTICGNWSNLIISDLPLPYSAAASATAPTISSGFGTGAAITANNGTIAFRVNVGTGGTASSGVVGLPASAVGWNCYATDLTTQSSSVFLTKQTASTTTTATFTNYNTAGTATAWVANDILSISCQGL